MLRAALMPFTLLPASVRQRALPHAPANAASPGGGRLTCETTPSVQTDPRLCKGRVLLTDIACQADSRAAIRVQDARRPRRITSCQRGGGGRGRRARGRGRGRGRGGGR